MQNENIETNKKNKIIKYFIGIFVILMALSTYLYYWIQHNEEKLTSIQFIESQEDKQKTQLSQLVSYLDNLGEKLDQLEDKIEVFDVYKKDIDNSLNEQSVDKLQEGYESVGQDLGNIKQGNNVENIEMNLLIAVNRINFKLFNNDDFIEKDVIEIKGLLGDDYANINFDELTFKDNITNVKKVFKKFNAAKHAITMDKYDNNKIIINQNEDLIDNSLKTKLRNSIKKHVRIYKIDNTMNIVDKKTILSQLDNNFINNVIDEEFNNNILDILVNENHKNIVREYFAEQHKYLRILDLVKKLNLYIIKRIE